MNARERERYRKRLVEQLAALGENVEEHRRLIEEGPSTPDFAGGDRAAELETMEVDSAIADSEAHLVEKIRHALDRIEDGTYGICEACGAKIPAARLDAKPSVSLCVSCQEEHEEGR